MRPVMRYCILVLFAITFAPLALAAQKSDDRAAKTSGEIELEGVWRGFVVEGTGQQPDQGPTHLELTIKGNHISAQRLGGEPGPLGEGTYKIKTGRLSLMDATQIRTQGKRRTYLGICKTEPELIKWCVATPGNKRPADFETKGQQFLLILKRQ